MSLTKESKIRVLESFYALDHILFGKEATQVKENLSDVGKTLYEEYQSSKGALLTIAMEMFNFLGHNPEKLEEQVGSDTIKEMAQESSNLARSNARKILESEKGQSFIKEEVKQARENTEENLSDVIDQKVNEVSKQISVDNLIVARTLYESEQPEKLTEWEGEILEDAYKVLRDHVIEVAEKINEEETSQ